jgi:hypothetical protein
METFHQQAAGIFQKNSEHFAHYLLTIPTNGTKRASSKQPAFFKKIVSILLTICSLSWLHKNYGHWVFFVCLPA